MARPPVPCPWLCELAAGYLRQFADARARRSARLWGYSFERKHGRNRVAFFVGFSTRRSRCTVFAAVRPQTGKLRQRLVRRRGSQFRRAYDLLTKYTARRPRFEFREQGEAAILRRVPLSQFPSHQREKYARNFFMETLALLVRSGLPETLARIKF